MKIYKSINNNIVSAFDDHGREMIVIGKGIGYKAIEGTDIDKSKITKTFTMDSQDNLNKLKDLLARIQKEYIEITDEILTYARNHLNKELNESAYFTLADHISFAVERMKKGMPFENILTNEIKRFYPREFEVGLFAIKQIEAKMNIDMSEGEAASVALHIMNATYYTSVSEAFKATQLLRDVIEYIIRYSETGLDTTGHYGERFIIHLKYLIQRIISNDIPEYSDDDVYEIMKTKHCNTVDLCEKVAAQIKKEHEYTLTKYEIACMAIHIQRIKQKR